MARRACPGCGNGDVRCSLVGPKIPAMGTPTAPAICIAPESFETTADGGESSRRASQVGFSRQVDHRGVAGPAGGQIRGLHLARRFAIARGTDEHRGDRVLTRDARRHKPPVRAAIAWRSRTRRPGRRRRSRPLQSSHGTSAAPPRAHQRRRRAARTPPAAWMARRARSPAPGSTRRDAPTDTRDRAGQQRSRRSVR